MNPIGNSATTQLAANIQQAPTVNQIAALRGTDQIQTPAPEQLVQGIEKPGESQASHIHVYA